MKGRQRVCSNRKGLCVNTNIICGPVMPLQSLMLKCAVSTQKMQLFWKVTAATNVCYPTKCSLRWALYNMIWIPNVAQCVLSIMLCHNHAVVRYSIRNRLDRRKWRFGRLMTKSHMKQACDVKVPDLRTVQSNTERKTWIKLLYLTWLQKSCIQANPCFVGMV